MAIRNRLGEALVIVGLAVIAGTISNSTAGSARRLNWVADRTMARVDEPRATTAAPSPGPSTAVADAPPVAAASEGFEIEHARAHELHGQGVLFLDARRTGVYAEGHIPGARNLAVWESDADDKVLALMGEVSPESTIVVYCQGGNCEDSHLLRTKLMAAGFSHVLVDKDGFPAWEKAGLPVEK